MTGPYQKHLENAQKAKHTREHDREKKKGIADERRAYNRRTEERTPANSKEFRDGWDRIFGGKKDE